MMLTNADHVRSLRIALQASPDNVALRQHLAQLLLSMGEFDAAEAEFKLALALDPHNFELTLGLARSYAQQGEDAQALTLLEELLQQEPDNAEILTLHAKLLLRTGDNTRAVSQFRQALMQDESLQEFDLAEQLGVMAQGPPSVSWDRSVSWDGEEDEKAIERPTITFENVGGMEALKEEIRLKIIYPLTHAEMYKAYGKSIGGGILMYGPPGCGKTHIARATAGEIRTGFISVSISDILDMWLGSSEKTCTICLIRLGEIRPVCCFLMKSMP